MIFQLLGILACAVAFFPTIAGILVVRNTDCSSFKGLLYSIVSFWILLATIYFASNAANAPVQLALSFGMAVVSWIWLGKFILPLSMQLSEENDRKDRLRRSTRKEGSNQGL